MVLWEELYCIVEMKVINNYVCFIHFYKAIFLPGTNTIVRLSTTDSIAKSIFSRTQDVFREIFLPSGYPDSVSDDYLTYQIWDTVQAFCSTITGTFTTQAILKSVGVGDAEATPFAAALTWVLKDGTGMVGRITFAWWKG